MKYRRHVAQDLFVLAASVAVAVGIVRFGLVDVFVVWAGDSVGWASFVAGMFFTSMLTTAPAIAVLGELTQEGNLFVVAALGAAGAVVGDPIQFDLVDSADQLLVSTTTGFTAGTWHHACAVEASTTNDFIQIFYPLVLA